ncbi:MAG: glycosyltransferase [Chitinophagaceae bacterium]
MSVNKKVLYISYDGMTDPLGQSQVIPYLQQLTKRGYEFTILSVEKKKRFRESEKKIRQLLAETGIKWETLLFTKHPPVISKIYDQWRLNNKAISLFRQQKFDLIHCRSYVAAATAIKLIDRYQVPFLFDMRGFWVDERVDSGHWNIHNPFYRFLYKVYKKKEKNYFSKSAHIISLTQKGKEELINNYRIPVDKISVIPCYADLEHFDYRKISEEEKQKARKQLGIADGQKVLSYLGSLGGWYMTDEMLDFFAAMKTKIPGAVFLLITQDDREMILAKAATKGITSEHIRIQPANRNEVPQYLSVSDWSIFFIKDVYSKRASSPTKQGEIMAMGIPIICNDIGDTGKIVEESGAGIVIRHFNTDQYYTVTDQLENLLSLDKANIRESAFKYYDLKTGAEEYLAAYRRISL